MATLAAVVGSEGYFIMMKNISINGDYSKLKILVSINLIGIIFYLYFASKIWAPTGGVDLGGGPGDPFIWVMTAFPFLAIFSLMNAIWLVMIIIKRKKIAFLKSIFFWVVVVIVWVLANRYDEYRQYRGDFVNHDVALVIGADC
ncbi:hypothetical protein [Xanthomonas albilineans]|uniref:hypothetical protein n=1 Tax=Xanthomonas albilineans TaxID=29447 RepID=UPI0012D3E8B9|nr:hypothetical protein [Xanthomonas albilineans]